MYITSKLINALIDGTLAALAVFIAGQTASPVWVIFISWLSYYLFGKSIKAALNTYVLILLGMALAMMIVSANHVLMPILGTKAIFIVVFVLIGSLTFIEGCKWFGNLAAYFMGLIIFFGTQKEVDIMTFIDLSIPLLTGLTIAWLAITLRTKVAARPKPSVF
ncbi:MAG TPA: DUF1097 domain-containing protein [Flavisolibacter sp.]|nr:DUF1097 domain-containing protein [Flavisolibacter sp.]